MTGKRAALITISSLALAGGTFALIRNRKRGNTYNAILGRIIQESPVLNANYIEYFDPSFHKGFDPNKYRKYTSTEARQVADSLRDSMFGEFLGFGTKEIPDGVRLSQVSEKYQNEYSEPLYAAIQAELEVDEQNKVVGIISRKKVSSQI